ncbi:hypothetical protein AAY473_027828 [Plecturocebus cupreus]
MDSVVREGFPEEVSLDGVVREGFPEEVSLDGVVREGFPEEVSLDGVVREGFPEVSLDRVVREGFPKEVSLDGVVREGFPEVSLDGVVREGFPKEVSLDGVVREGFPKEVSLDGVVREGFPEEVSLDRVVREGFPKEVSLDSVVREGFPKEVSLNGVVTEGFPEEVSLDGVIREGFPEEVSLEQSLSLQDAARMLPQRPHACAAPHPAQTLLACYGMRQARLPTRVVPHSCQGCVSSEESNRKQPLEVLTPVGERFLEGRAGLRIHKDLDSRELRPQRLQERLWKQGLATQEGQPADPTDEAWPAALPRAHHGQRETKQLDLAVLQTSSFLPQLPQRSPLRLRALWASGAQAGAGRTTGSKANMMDGTIQEEINPEARVPGELGGVSILQMLNESAGQSAQQHSLARQGRPSSPEVAPHGGWDQDNMGRTKAWRKPNFYGVLERGLSAAPPARSTPGYSKAPAFIPATGKLSENKPSAIPQWDPVAKLNSLSIFQSRIQPNVVEHFTPKFFFILTPQWEQGLHPILSGQCGPAKACGREVVGGSGYWGRARAGLEKQSLSDRERVRTPASRQLLPPALLASREHLGPPSLPIRGPDAGTLDRRGPSASSSSAPWAEAFPGRGAGSEDLKEQPSASPPGAGTSPRPVVPYVCSTRPDLPIFRWRHEHRPPAFPSVTSAAWPISPQAPSDQILSQNQEAAPTIPLPAPRRHRQRGILQEPSPTRREPHGNSQASLWDQARLPTCSAHTCSHTQSQVPDPQLGISPAAQPTHTEPISLPSVGQRGDASNESSRLTGLTMQQREMKPPDPIS